MNTKILIAVYIVALVAANLLVAWLGPWFSPINAFVLIGLDLSLRDKMHDKWDGNPYKIGALIAAAGVISYLLNPAAGQIAVASVLAFCASMLADSSVYQVMRSRPWLVRANGSNAAGAMVDSILFPTLAFGVLMPQIVALQFIAKVAGGAVWSYLLRK